MLMLLLFSISASFAAEADDNLQAINETGTEQVSLSDESMDGSLQSENDNQGDSLGESTRDNEKLGVCVDDASEDVFKSIVAIFFITDTPCMA